MIANRSISNQTDDLVFLEDEITRIIFVYVSPCVIFIGTVANILSILVLSKKTMRRSTTMFYLLILSSADLLVLYTGLLRYWIVMAFDVDIRLYSDFICKLHAFLVYFSLDFASWILVAVTMDRCISVMRPLKARVCCSHNVSKVIVVVLFVTMVFINSHLFFTVEIISRNGSKPICQEANATFVFVSKIWPWIDFAVFCFVPFGIMIIANLLIIRRVSASVKTLKNMTVDNDISRSFDSLYTRRTSLRSNHISGEQSEQISTITETFENHGFSNNAVNKTAMNNSTRLQTSTNVTVMLLTVNFVFFLCTTPIAVYFIGQHYWETRDLHPHRIAVQNLAYCIVNILQYLNNSVHFFLYCFTGKRFRNEFYKLFSRKRRSVVFQ
ncbi:unnamed protein product [Mytilus coruscus]|uniref:G-protein coupled receptors family 1 profile domain-containing protein n=1 Tax=Mytilus coruscus TaxID=42192 RepID=A0A6J8CAM3_MYTCO|nr:unnamed protein product [Mytilus coruscus]